MYDREVRISNSKLLCAVGEAAEPGCPGGLLAVVTQLGDMMAEAHAAVAPVVGEIPPPDLAEMQEKAVEGLLRAFEGNVFWGLVDVHHEAEEARGLLATGTRALGFIGGRSSGRRGRRCCGAGGV